MENLLWWLFTGGRGGRNRARIIVLLIQKPCNANVISKELNLNYKTVNHHLKLLMDNGLIQRTEGVKYGAFYFVSDKMKSKNEVFNRILEDLKIGA